MIIQRLEITNFRNIASAKLAFNPNVNIIFGANGSGKTSVLEAISLLAHGKSFRSHLSRPLVKHGQKSTVLFSSLVDVDSGNELPVGIEKHISKGTTVKINRAKARSTSELAKLLPLMVVDGSAFSVVDGPSKERRKILDWLLFHVEPQFHALWLGFYKALKQRNALLRRGIINGHEFDVWTAQCVEYGDALNQLRGQGFERLLLDLVKVCDSLAVGLEAHYFAGWNSEVDLNSLFLEKLEGDIQRQTTRAGPHRCDLLLTCPEGKVSEVFSRGQKKTAILAIYLAVLRQFITERYSKPIIALDDLPAELDKDHISSVVAQLLGQSKQIFITTINKEQVLDILPPETPKTVFHVEHGVIKEFETL